MFEPGTSYQVNNNWNWLVFPTKEKAEFGRKAGIHSTTIWNDNDNVVRRAIDDWNENYDLGITSLSPRSCFVVIENDSILVKVIGVQVGWIVMVDSQGELLCEGRFTQLTE